LSHTPRGTAGWTALKLLVNKTTDPDAMQRLVARLRARAHGGTNFPSAAPNDASTPAPMPAATAAPKSTAPTHAPTRVPTWGWERRVIARIVRKHAARVAPSRAPAEVKSAAAHPATAGPTAMPTSASAAFELGDAGSTHCIRGGRIRAAAQCREAAAAMHMPFESISRGTAAHPAGCYLNEKDGKLHFNPDEWGHSHAQSIPICALLTRGASSTGVPFVHL
jgi:hypothetical protein